MLHKKDCLKEEEMMLIGQRILGMEGPGFGIIQFSLFTEHPLQASKQVALESGIGINFCVMAKGCVPLAAAIKFMAPDRGKDGSVEIRLLLIIDAGEVVNSEHVDVRIHFFDEVTFIRQFPDLR